MLTDEEKLWQVWGQAGSLYDFWAASKTLTTICSLSCMPWMDKRP